jgi:hypothetical protein
MKRAQCTISASRALIVGTDDDAADVGAFVLRCVG